jgi:hypothetical protein
VLAILNSIRNAGSTYTWVFPVQVDTVEVVIVHERNQVVLELFTIRRLRCLAQDLEGAGLGAECPASKRNNLLDSRHGFEELELLLNDRICDFNSVVSSGNVRECKMNVSVLSRINLIDVHSQALAIEVPRLKVCHFDLACWSRTFDNVSAAITDT